MYDRKTFYDRVRHAPFGGRLSASQVKGLDRLLSEAEGREDISLNELAYALATVLHETASRMLPLAEFGKGKGKKYGRPDPVTKKVYYGRGDVQLTWKANYAKAGKALGIDLVNKPDLALDPAISAQILFSGMTEGWFTGKKLADYFGAGSEDPISARRIINGTDRAQLIAGHYRAFKAALEDADVATPLPADVADDAEQPDGKPLTKSKTVGGGVIAAAAGAAGVIPSFLSSLENPYALAGLGLIVVALALGVFLVVKGRIDVREIAGV